jgi:hypothetical protein
VAGSRHCPPALRLLPYQAPAAPAPAAVLRWWMAAAGGTGT